MFNDLTDIPLSSEDNEVGRRLWEFVRNILDLSFKCLKEDGKYLNHVSEIKDVIFYYLTTNVMGFNCISAGGRYGMYVCTDSVRRSVESAARESDVQQTHGVGSLLPGRVSHKTLTSGTLTCSFTDFIRRF